MTKLSANSDVRQFVSKEVYTAFGDKSAQFVSDNIVKLYEFVHVFFNLHYKAKDSNVESVSVLFKGLRCIMFVIR